jgi:putative transport protein
LISRSRGAGHFLRAVTNTPALGAGQQILRDLGIEPGIVDQMGMSYAMAYPFGICGILLHVAGARPVSH